MEGKSKKHVRNCFFAFAFAFAFTLEGWQLEEWIHLQVGVEGRHHNAIEKQIECPRQK